ncbi:MAG: DUF2141 domain-containing protein [Proteobacteria bacterium]|nr:DUF2141 domain-containing protein [Pseudomonadota bacterium]
MRHLSSLLFLGILLCSALAFAEETFTVSGEIKFPKRKGEIYVWLKTQEEFEKRGEPASPARSLMIKPSPQQLKAKKVTFEFVDVPKGIYGIVCIQDLNKNGKMDYMEGGFHQIAIEPFGYSGPRFLAAAQWDDAKFEVDKDISGIEILMSGP